MSQTSFVELLIGNGIGPTERLEKIARLLDWSPVQALVEKVRSGDSGRPPYPPLAMFKAILLLQQKRLEHCQGRIGRPPAVARANLFDQRLNRRPVKQPGNLFQPLVAAMPFPINSSTKLVWLMANPRS